MPITCQSAGSNSARNRGVEQWVRVHRAEKNLRLSAPEKKGIFLVCHLGTLYSPVKQSGFDDGAFVLWVNRIDQRGGAGTNCSTSLDTPIYSSPPIAYTIYLTSGVGVYFPRDGQVSPGPCTYFCRIVVARETCQDLPPASRAVKPTGAFALFPFRSVESVFPPWQ
jgi:hypothetical protein